jgi:multidrug efflux pump subunit AcrA (membrane-fusion protein)
MNAKQSRDIGNADADRQITEYNQKLDDLQKGAKDIDIAAQELSVQQRQNALTDANNTLSDYTIVAPFDGTMASVSGQVGLSAVTAASNGATSLGTIVTDKKLIQVTLNETDIAKVHIGQPATITFDALDGVTATGTVADIDGLGTITQGVVTYKVKIFFASTDDRIKSSMSASAIITTDSKENVLVIQSSALKHDTSGYYVESDGSTFTSSSSQAFASSTRRFMRATSTEATSTRMGGYSSTSTRSTSTRSIERQARTATLPSTTQLAKIPVTIGIQGDSLTEIVSGLTEGQQIIIKKTTGTAKATAAPSITSLFRPGGQNQRQGAAVRAQ